MIVRGMFCLAFDGRKDKTQLLEEREITIKDKNGKTVVTSVMAQCQGKKEHMPCLAYSHKANGAYVCFATLDKSDGYYTALKLYRVLEDTESTGTVMMLSADGCAVVSFVTFIFHGCKDAFVLGQRLNLINLPDQKTYILPLPLSTKSYSRFPLINHGWNPPKTCSFWHEKIGK